MSKLYLRGKYIWYRFTDQYGTPHREPLKMKIGEVKRNKKGEILFPKEAVHIKDVNDNKVRLRTWGIEEHQQKNIKLSEAFKKFKEYKGTKLKPRTWRNHDIAINRLIAFAGDHPLGSYTTDLFIKFRAHLQESVSKKSGEDAKPVHLTDYGVSFYLRTVRPTFSWAVRKSYLAQNPINEAVLITPKLKKPITYSAEQMEKLIETAREKYGTTVADQLTFLMLTGWRSGESCAVKWEDVYWDEEYIIRNNQKGSRYEAFPLYPKLKLFLQGVSRRYEPYIFRFRVQSNLGLWFRKVRDELGYSKRLNVHSIRKYTTTHLIRSGIPLGVVGEILGHKDVKTTKNHYTAFTVADQNKVMRDMFRADSVPPLSNT